MSWCGKNKQKNPKPEAEPCFLLLLTLLLPLALLVMLESLLATISTSFADITTQVELSSPERQLLRKTKWGERKVRQDSQEENRGQIFTLYNFSSNAGVPVHLGGLSWTTENRNYFQLRISLPHVSQVWKNQTPGLFSLKTSSLFSQSVWLEHRTTFA